MEQGTREKRIKLWLTVVVLATYAFLLFKFPRHSPDPLIPGTWNAKGEFLPSSLSLLPIMGACVFALLMLRRFAILAIVVIVSYVFVSASHPTVQDRIKKELPQYKAYVESGKAFGLPSESKEGKRRLIYWNWGIRGIDDSYGILYDSSDQIKTLDEASIKDKVNQLNAGVEQLREVRRIEPCWFLVEGT